MEEALPRLVDKALLLVDKHRAMEDTRKHKMMSKGSTSGQCNQKPRVWQPAPAKPINPPQ